MSDQPHDEFRLHYGRNVLDDPTQRAEEIQELRSRIYARERAKRQGADFIPEPGISVIVPTYRGAERVDKLLDSFAEQTLDHSRFELVVVENGERDGVRDVITKFARSHPAMTIRYFYNQTASAGAARNLGIDLARYSRTTFVDDDDQLGPKFLEKALSLSTGSNLVLSPIVDVHNGGERVFENTLNSRIGKLYGNEQTRIVDVPWALGFNACKLAPTWMLRPLRFKENLKSGEDLVFWAQLLERPETQVVAVAPSEEAAYIRNLRAGSISRRDATLDFAVSERLDCIAELEEIKVPEGSKAAQCLGHLIRAQANFIARYVEANPNAEQRVIGLLENRKLRSFPWAALNDGKARDLAFVYCFAPFSDTSAVVAAKAIAERQRVVDIISNDMSSVRRRDEAVSALADRWIDQRTLVDATPSFAGWPAIADFSRKALLVADRDHALKGPYETLYSRALWIGSHVAAALFKLQHWRIHWTAEFSDPLRRDAEGNPRVGPAGDDELWSRIREGVRSRGFIDFDPVSVFELSEVAAFVLADELIFTNENQFQYMLDLTDNFKLRDIVKSKAIIRQHPTPPARAYEIVKTDYAVPSGVVNIAYFGSFYPNRGIGDLLVALANCSTGVRRKVRLHVFSNKANDVRESARHLGVGACVYAENYLSYMEFLNATRLFDVLLVNDVERGDNLPINPFLPSKLSDYSGSGRAVWAVVDEGSPLSRMVVDYRSPVGDSAAMVRVLEQIVEDTFESGLS